jgi:hypothetical protein
VKINLERIKYMKLLLLLILSLPSLCLGGVITSQTFDPGQKDINVTYQWDTSNYEDGPRYLTLKVWDAAGNITEKTIETMICNTSVKYSGPNGANAYSTSLTALNSGAAYYLARGVSFTGDFDYSVDKPTALLGGYVCGYTSVDSMTTIIGSLTVSGGELTLDSVVIQ